MTITSGDDADDLEASLSQFNFRVSRQLPGVLTSLSSRYVISSKGFCGPGGTTARYAQRVAADYSADVRLLSVDVFDSETNERVFAAHLDNDDGCPYAFFSEVAAALARNWEDGEVEGPASRDR